MAKKTQEPLVGSQLARWHSSGAGQVTGVPAQLPDLHWSEVVQASPSLQGLPSAFGLSRTAIATRCLPSMSSSMISRFPR